MNSRADCSGGTSEKLLESADALSEGARNLAPPERIASRPFVGGRKVWESALVGQGLDE